MCEPSEHWSRLRESLCAFVAVALVATVAARDASAARVRRAAERTTDLVGVVVRVADGEVFVDLGRPRGVSPGDRVQLLRRVEVEHPVTGRAIVDYFVIGVVELADVGEELSFARLTTGEPLEHTPQVGDMARVVSMRGAPTTPPDAAAVVAVEGAAPGAADCPPCEADPEARSVHDAWVLSLGKPLADRMSVWSAWLLEYPASPYADRVTREIAWLEHLLELSRRIPPRAGRVRLLHRPPGGLEEGGWFTPAFTVTDPDAVQRVQLHIRRQSEADYRTILLERTGDYTWQTDIAPGDLVDGAVAYFAEVVDRSGAVAASWRTAGEPQSVQLVSPATPPERRDRSRARVRVDYVDFYLSDPWRDSYWQLEADYTYLLRTWLYAVRAGAGIISGRGGPKEEIVLSPDDPDYVAPRSLTTTYAYLELDFRLHEYVYLLTRGIAGSLRDAPDDRDDGESLLGFTGGVRLGHPDRTNLLLRYTITQTIGMEGGVNLVLALLEDFPMGAEVIVTNFPVGEDLGVRIGVQAGWRGLDWFEIALRVGYDIRDINHSGASVGLDLAFDW